LSPSFNHYNPKHLKNHKSLLIVNFDEQLIIIHNKMTKEEEKEKKECNLKK
jgi:hypothetical protein